MPTKKHNLLLHRTFQYLGIILIVAAMGSGYWYWKQAQAGVTQKTANNQGLVGYWSFDESAGTKAGDASGNANTGTLTNMDPATDWVDGKLGKALDFDGTNDYADAGSGSSLRISGALSMSFWMYGRGSSADAYIAGTAGTNLEGYSCTHHNGATVYCYLQNGTNSISAAVGTNVWAHIMFTWDGTTGTNGKKLYVNGVLQSQGTSTQSALSGWGNFRVGEDATATRTRFNGKVDELRVYNRALEETEIKNLYNLGAAKLQKTQSSDLTSGLVGYWPFNGKDVSGTTVYDRSTGGNNGTLTNGPTVTEGKAGQALSFNGTNQYVSAPYAGTDFERTDPFTLSAWIKLTSSGTSQAILGKITGGNKGISFGAKVSATAYGNANAFYMWIINNGDANGIVVSTPTNSLTYGVWTHVIVTYDGSSSASGVKIYKDGVSLPLTTHYNTLSATIKPGVNWRIGDDYTNDWFSGSMDEPRIYNRALSANEIWDLYQMGNPDKVNAADSQGDSLEKGLVGYWKLDDVSGTSAADASGNANTGTLTNGPTWTTGQIGGATNFDGTDDYAEIPSDAKFDSSIGTWSFWAKTDTLPVTTNDSIFFRASNSGSNNGLNMYVNTIGRFGFQIKDGSGQVAGNAATSVAANDGSWHHVALTWTRSSGGTNNLYIDGKLSVSGTNTAAWAFASQPVRLADASDAYWEIFDGQLDEIRIYNRALSAEEVSKLYKMTAPDNPDTGLVGYWPFNGKDLSGTTAYDRSGKGNNGTLTNGPTVTEGKAGQALNFDGTNQYVTMGNVANIGAGDASMSAWIKPPNADQSGAPIIGKRQGSYPYPQYVMSIGTALPSGNFTASKKISIVFYNGSGSFSTDSQTYVTVNDVADGNWHHVTATRSGSTVKIYVDGTNMSLTTVVGGVANDTTNAGNFTVGYNNGVSYFTGSVDEPRIYNRALSASEVFAQYAAGESSKKTCGTVADADGNLYGTVVIGNQCWMKQNLRVGMRIAASTNQTNNATIEKYCYSDSDANCTSANPNQPDGGLYQWNEAMQYSTTAGARGICPAGFHIPTDAEQWTLENYLKDAGQTCNASRSGTYECSTAGTKLKPSGISGFEGNLAGVANAGSFNSRGSYGYFWSSSESGATAWSRSLGSANATVYRDAVSKTIALSVRCIHD